MREDKQAILATAVGIARLRLRTGDVQGASDVLDDAVDRCHREHWDACLADGRSPELIELLLGPRDEKVKRVIEHGSDEIDGQEAAARAIRIETLRPSGYLPAPGMTDLMVTPESIDAYLAENPPPCEETS